MVIDGAAAANSERVTSLPADALVVDGAACSADGALAVLPGTADGVSGLTADVLRGVEACFTSGIVSEALTCGRWAGPVNNATYFFGGGDVLTVGEGASAVELPAATRFLSVQFPDTTRRSCVYTASRAAEGGEGGSSGGETGSEPNGQPGGEDSPSPIDEEESTCFPGTATVEVAGRGDMAMEDLKLGDRVRVSATAFEPIVLFTHRDPAAVGAYVALTTAGGRVLVSTTGHLVYAADEATAGGWALKAAGSVAVSDTLPLGAAAGNATTANDVVVSVAPSPGAGLYNPHTPSGDLVVDGVRYVHHRHAGWRRACADGACRSRCVVRAGRGNVGGNGAGRGGPEAGGGRAVGGRVVGVGGPLSGAEWE